MVLSCCNWHFWIKVVLVKKNGNVPMVCYRPSVLWEQAMNSKCGTSGGKINQTDKRLSGDVSEIYIRKHSLTMKSDTPQCSCCQQFSDNENPRGLLTIKLDQIFSSLWLIDCKFVQHPRPPYNVSISFYYTLEHVLFKVIGVISLKRGATVSQISSWDSLRYFLF